MKQVVPAGKSHSLVTQIFGAKTPTDTVLLMFAGSGLRLSSRLAPGALTNACAEVTPGLFTVTTQLCVNWVGGKPFTPPFRTVPPGIKVKLKPEGVPSNPGQVNTKPAAPS